MDHIKDTWTKQAKTFGKSHAASWKDVYAIQLEIDTIGQFIKPGHAVLDVGCANGYSAFNQLSRNPARIVGVDFVPEMIEHANAAKREQSLGDQITFDVADVRKLPFAEGSFDVVYTTRVLINLPSWEQQQQGIEECIRVAKPGGTVVLSEAFYEPLVRLNALRTVVGLEPLLEHDFNRYLKKPRLEAFLQAKGLEHRTLQFCGVYYVGSRFVRELIADLPDALNYQNEINTLFFELEKKFGSNHDLGIQQAVVIRK